MNIMLIGDKTDPSALGAKLKTAIIDRLKENGHPFTAYDLQKEDLHHCIGCFHCWVKDPGRCVFNDIGRKLNQDYVESDLVILISPVRYGCYSTVIRRFWDRNLPNILPFFKKINGEVHHAPRYDKYPQLVVVGYGEDLNSSEMETFKILTDANAVNFQIEEAQTYFCGSDEAVGLVLNSIAAIINRVKEESL